MRKHRKKNDAYDKYLEGPVWKNIRAAALKRDKRICRACRGKATVVHHIRYPKNLGEEQMEWLYSLCAPCHNAIHRATKTMSLQEATELILASATDNVIYLPLRKKKRKQPSSKKRKVRPKRTASRRKPSKLELENERLRQFFKANTE